MFIAALLTIARAWKQPKCPSIEERINYYGDGLVDKLCLTLATPWTVARRAPPLSMGFSRQEYWSELPFPSPGDHPDPGIKPVLAASQANSLPLRL